jgi:hypothetical protein
MISAHTLFLRLMDATATEDAGDQAIVGLTTVPGDTVREVGLDFVPCSSLFFAGPES